ncbi:glutamyl-tRNA synthetase [Secundilactobacillus oryzae JCM 18671]|uniref:Glutamate--tRNA ligase n=1 Tax=Secundilactobacillus oryzae JCM 18671 TaxID=1291743 RepID=A0A081BJD0_9LACO|nr:glutamate--tRNA ligase [Secundilactobacillus oryzae]GAK48148.1 glutamyl-tRNA synthetase [Secundilactobacillus oryzae JCM 18671]
MANKSIRVRYAPSPTGHLHIGNARTALFNYLYARHNKGKFIIRIEDTDTKRNIEDGERSQLDNLKWLGMDWDEGPDKPGDFGPYRQSERGDIYKPLIQQLLDEGKAYESYKSEEELQADRDAQKARKEMPHYEYEFAGMTDAEREAKIADAKAKGIQPVIRFRVPENKTYAWDDIVKGNVSFESGTIGGDFVIAKADGTPTYNFAVVVDDHMMEISHVFRGDDHVANTPKQLMIYEAFGWEAPQFGHMSLIISKDTGKKLSKRDESVLQFIEQYRELGYLPDALLNFIILLGWSPVGEEEIFSLKDFVKMYDEKRLSKSPATFDSKKLEWINNQYVKKSDEDEVMHLALIQLIKSGNLPENPDAKTIEWARKLINVYKQQMSYMAQINEMASVFFEEPEQVEGEALEELNNNEDALQVLEELYKRLQAIAIFDKVEIFQTIKAIQRETGIKGRKLWMPIRIAVTHEMHGPELPESIELVGRETALEHVKQTIDQIK